MATTQFTCTEENMQWNANVAIGELLKKLEKDGILNMPADQIMHNYAVIFTKKGAISKAWDVMFNNDDKLGYFIVVKK